MNTMTPLADAAMKGHRATLARIHPAVLQATPEELLAAGWGDTPRERIPADWKRRKGPDIDRFERLSASRRKATATRKGRARR